MLDQARFYEALVGLKTETYLRQDFDSNFRNEKVFYVVDLIFWCQWMVKYVFEESKVAFYILPVCCLNDQIAERDSCIDYRIRSLLISISP